MNDEIRIKKLQAEIDATLAFKSKKFITRSEWGSINFKNAEPDIQKIFSVLDLLRILPLDYLTDNVADKMCNAISQVRPSFDKIDKFTIEQDNAASARNGIVNEIRRLTDPIIEAVTPWIPFLAYQKGDITQNIEKLTASVTESTRIVESSKANISAKAKEIDEIIIKAREASAGAGAAVFTQDFLKESKDLETQANPWLKRAAWLGLATVVIASATWFWTPAGLDNGQIVQKVASKLIAMSVLLTATIWCGRLYKALRHQAAINKHRALSLQTFQAFSAAASDPQTKNAVLLETTRSIFSLQDTGFVDSSGSARESNIIEIAKSVTEHE